MPNMHITIQATSPDLIAPGTDGKNEFDADGIVIIALENQTMADNDTCESLGMTQTSHCLEGGDISSEIAVASLLSCPTIGRMVFAVVARMVLDNLNTPENIAKLSEPTAKALQEVLDKQQEQDARTQSKS